MNLRHSSQFSISRNTGNSPPWVNTGWLGTVLQNDWVLWFTLKSRGNCFLKKNPTLPIPTQWWSNAWEQEAGQGESSCSPPEGDFPQSSWSPLCLFLKNYSKCGLQISGVSSAGHLFRDVNPRSPDRPNWELRRWGPGTRVSTSLRRAASPLCNGKRPAPSVSSHAWPRGHRVAFSSASVILFCRPSGHAHIPRLTSSWVHRYRRVPRSSRSYHSDSQRGKTPLLNRTHVV